MQERLKNIYSSLRFKQIMVIRRPDKNETCYTKNESCTTKFIPKSN